MRRAQNRGVAPNILLIVLASLLAFTGARAGAQTGGPAFELASRHAGVQLYPAANAIACEDTILVRRLRSNAGQLSLYLISVFEVDGASINGKPASFKRGDESLAFDDTPSDSEFTVVVSYGGTLSFTSDEVQLTSARAVLREDLVFPRAEKELLGNCRFTITVPYGWQTVAPGKLVSKTNVADSTTYVWYESGRLTDVEWIIAGNYRLESHLTTPEGVSISVYRFPDDTIPETGSDTLVATPDSAQQSQRRERLDSLAARVLAFYSVRFSPYRFAKLDLIEVDDWVAGRNVLAIAAPSFILIKQAAFDSPDPFNQPQSVLPHEIGHQWWPLTVFIPDEDDALLAEGMCEYSARLFHESEGALTPRDSLSHHPLLRPLLLKSAAHEDIPLQQKADLRNTQTHYLKAQYVHHMLREIMGDSGFAALYKAYAAAYATKMGGMDAFERLAENISGRNLAWFFDQWVKRRGIPRMRIYNVKAVPIGNSWVTRGRVRIIGYEPYTTFCDIGVRTVAGLSKQRVWLGDTTTHAPGDTMNDAGMHNDVPFVITTNEKPLEAVLDPDWGILKMKKMAARLGDLRDPGEGVMIVGRTPRLWELARKDSTTLAGAGWNISMKADSAATLNDFQRSRVLIYGKPSENSHAGELAGKFGQGFRNDSLTVNGEAVFDSSLALIQIIDNPYYANGAIVWIAPLTDQAAPVLLPFDASWVVQRGAEIISSGTWNVTDDDLRVPLE